MKLNIKIIEGKFNKFAEVSSPENYCFYDKDAEERNYIEKIFTPITDRDKIEEKFILVEGNADILNEELHRGDQ